MTCMRSGVAAILVCILGAAFILFPTASHNQDYLPEKQDSTWRSYRDSLIGERIFVEAEKERIDTRSMGEIIVWAGKQFLGSPYAAHTLEELGGERLVVNLRAFDCVTFVESVLALSQCIKARRTTFGEFKNRLQALRYRSGTLDGYASRLHYFSEWIADNHARKSIRNITPMLGGELTTKRLNWMTTHRTAYQQLSDQRQYERIAEVERKRSTVPLAQIPQSSLQSISDQLHPGDIVAFVSKRPGLDVEHVSFAVPSDDGSVHLLHASDRSKEVVLTEETLLQYVRYLPNSSGIMVARPLD